MKTVAGFILGVIMAAAGLAYAQGITNVEDYVTTTWPAAGEVVTPHDTTLLANPGMIRADAAGAVTATCRNSAAAITLTLTAGESFPCVVKLVKDTGTDAITIHVFYDK